MKSMKKLTIMLGGLALIPSTLAYIDPGTGGMIATSVGGFTYFLLAATGGFIIHKLYKPAKGFIVRILKRK